MPYLFSYAGGKVVQLSINYYFHTATPFILHQKLDLSHLYSETSVELSVTYKKLHFIRMIITS